MLPSVLFLSAAWFFILQKQLNLIYLAKVQQDQIPLNYDEYRYHRPEPRNESQPRHECGKSPSFDSFFKQSDAVRSSRDEDKTIYELFFRSLYQQSSSVYNNFTYVELGAFNGIRESNTRFFDICLHWDGLLIEANPMKYPRLLQTRPHAHRLNYAPSCTYPQQIGFHSVSFSIAAQANVPTGLDNTTLIQIPCDRLTPALIDLLDGYVTFFSLDVEGAEAMVLSTVDFSKIHVDIWMVESINNFCQGNCSSRDESHAILQRAGYVGFVDVVFASTLFVKPKSKYWKILQERHPSKRLPSLPLVP